MMKFERLDYRIDMNFTFKSRHDFLICIDSDGCVFDSMDVKQKQFFHPRIVSHWGLESIAEEVCELAEYVNMRSSYRGSNRFLALNRTFELLQKTNAYAQSTIELPWLEPLAAWVEAEPNLHHETLKAVVAEDPRMQSVLDWSLAINQDIKENMGPVSHFEGVREALEDLRERADLAVVSLSPHHALQSEWGGAGLDELVDGIAGLDVGGKPLQVNLAIQQSGVSPERVLLLGDAPGDLRTAEECTIAFYPIFPGRETASWNQFMNEDADHFFAGRYREQREAQLIREYQELLSEDPPAGL